MRMRHAICLFIATTLSLCDSLPARAAELNEAALSANKAPPGAIWLDSLGVSYIEQEWGQARARRSVERHPLTIGGKVFRHGVGTHAASEMRIDLKGAAEQFVSFVGVDDETAKKGSVTFEVWVDGKRAAESGRMAGGDAPKRIDADLRGAKRMTLLVGDADDGIDFDHADWAGAVIVLAPGAAAKPQSVSLLEGAATVPAIIHSDSPQPAIHGPRIVGSTPGHAFQLPHSGHG